VKIRMVAAAALVGASALGAGGIARPSLVPTARFDVVVVDAGHGGEDDGARGAAGLLEKDVALDVAARLAQQLKARGLTVVMTRSSDRFVSLQERTAIANRARADLFISVHANASKYHKARGIETFFASAEASDDAAHELAAAENLAFGEAAARLASGDPLLAILGDMIVTEHLEDSQEFARIAQARIGKTGAARSRGVKQAPFVVLMGVNMPAVLVELGFLTNVKDEKTLRSAQERDRLAAGLARAVDVFRARQDARQGPRVEAGEAGG